MILRKMRYIYQTPYLKGTRGPRGALSFIIMAGFPLPSHRALLAVSTSSAI
jgi:hypothetical protein